jgi:hypothetical protein
MFRKKMTKLLLVLGFGEQYPNMYDPAKPEFNCYQRAHQHMLETLPNILSMLLIGGIRHPVSLFSF